MRWRASLAYSRGRKMRQPAPVSEASEIGWRSAGRSAAARNTTRSAKCKCFSNCMVPHGSRKSKRVSPDDRSIHNQAGYRRFKEGKGIFMFSIEVWRTEVCKGLDADLVAKAIKEKGWLVHDTGRLTKQDRLPGQTQRTRFYVVKDAILGHTEDDDAEGAA